MRLKEKILSPEDLHHLSATASRPMVFTNGVFDLLHAGHVTYLEEARSLGASLFVGLNSDSSARLLEKDPHRPINGQQDRATLVAALESVSFVALFDERTPIELIKKIRPDIYVKGGDYDIESLEETACVRSWGGSAAALVFLGGYSTTCLLKRIQALPH